MNPHPQNADEPADDELDEVEVDDVEVEGLGRVDPAVLEFVRALNRLDD